MKPVGPEQIQDAHEHDYIALCIGNLKKYKRMKPACLPAGRQGRIKFRTRTSMIILLCVSAT